MGLFSKESCTFCDAQVGMLKRTKLKSKEYICNDCKRKTNYYARMDYTTREAAQSMMETLPLEEAEFEKSFDNASNRFESAERSWTTWHIGSDTIHYRCNTRTGGFQLRTGSCDSYESIPVFWFDRVMPYEFSSQGDDFFAGSRRTEMLNQDAAYVTLEVSKDDEGKPERCSVTIPYDVETIREIRLQLDADSQERLDQVQDFVNRLNEDRRVCLRKALHTQEQQEKMHLRNLGDTAAAAIKAAAKGEDVTEALKEGIQTANAIEEGKVRRGFFGKLLK